MPVVLCARRGVSNVFGLGQLVNTIHQCFVPHDATGHWGTSLRGQQPLQGDFGHFNPGRATWAHHKLALHSVAAVLCTK